MEVFSTMRYPPTQTSSLYSSCAYLFRLLTDAIYSLNTSSFNAASLLTGANCFVLSNALYYYGVMSMHVHHAVKASLVRDSRPGGGVDGSRCCG